MSYVISCTRGDRLGPLCRRPACAAIGDATLGEPTDCRSASSHNVTRDRSSLLQPTSFSKNGLRSFPMRWLLAHAVIDRLILMVQSSSLAARATASGAAKEARQGAAKHDGRGSEFTSAKIQFLASAARCWPNPRQHREFRMRSAGAPSLWHDWLRPIGSVALSGDFGDDGFSAESLTDRRL